MLNVWAAAKAWSATAKARAIMTKVGIVLVTAFLMFSTGYMIARGNCKAAQASSLAKELKATDKFVVDRVEQSTAADKRSRELEKKLSYTQEKLREAIDAKDRPSSCDLSDDEFLRINELAAEAEGQ